MKFCLCIAKCGWDLGRGFFSVVLRMGEEERKKTYDVHRILSLLAGWRGKEMMQESGGFDDLIRKL